MPVRDSALKKFGENIGKILETRTLSQEALAEGADVDRTYVGGVWRGEWHPPTQSGQRQLAIGVSLRLKEDRPMNRKKLQFRQYRITRQSQRFASKCAEIVLHCALW